MATANSLLSEERFLCSVCLDVFTEPVTTPCGHNFCRACINTYWDNSNIYQCPYCKQEFSPRPELQVNTTMSELAAEFKKSVQVKAFTPDPQFPEIADVPCDICSEIKEKAFKSCLMCLTSFCEVHLEPHLRVAGLKSHTLINPVRNLDDKICEKHNKITELYCRTDQVFVCVLCLKTDHKSHNVVPLEEEYEAEMAKKDDAMADIQKMIQSRSEKISEIENSLDVCQREKEKEKEASVQVFTDLICHIQKRQAELVEKIEERCKSEKEKAEGFLKEMRMEIAELENRSSQLELLSQSEDHHHFLQNFRTLCSPLKKDWANIAVGRDLSFEAVRGAVTLLKQRVDETLEELPEIKMKKMREHAVDLTFDPDTAFRTLVISEDGKQVTNVDVNQNVPNNPKRFGVFADVLSNEGFTTGQFYYEVQVKGKTCWIVGVVRESVERKKKIHLKVENGFWTFGLNEGKYTCTGRTITLKDKLQKVGIFVDYNKGVVSFYNADSKSHIHSYTDQRFTEKLYPYFYTEERENGTNSAPLIITPVPQTY